MAQIESLICGLDAGPVKTALLSALTSRAEGEPVKKREVVALLDCVEDIYVVLDTSRATKMVERVVEQLERLVDVIVSLE